MDVPSVGRLVCSKKGRDKGNYYIITRVINDRLVEAANGSNRKLKNPKKKNVKHLKLYFLVDEELGDAIRAKSAKDEELFRALNKLLQEINNQE